MGQAAARHDFVVVIPVADRPRHLAACLDSLAELRRCFPYPGEVSVLVADDSRDADNLARHRQLVGQYRHAGLAGHYLGPAEQLVLLDALPLGLRARLPRVLGAHAPESFFHKGASVTRNIAYLWLNRLPVQTRPRLFWFVDSDQEFRVERAATDGHAESLAIDYLNGLDRIFSETPVQVLTGKVVGDPPVSPAVMAGTCLDDVIACLTELAALPPDAACSFHAAGEGRADEAAYHDMADLFGFRTSATAWRYHCTLEGPHDHAACLDDFAQRLDRFFDGEHPTRRNFYQPDDLLAGVKPARTLYTGNYVLAESTLAWFIPFADQRLRMAGPTLGRIIRAELGDRFVSANLPMLHRRTVAGLGQSECRPGIERGEERVDLSGEFERQYFGDVLLFAMERLIGLGYPATRLAPAQVTGAVEETEAALRARYTGQREHTWAKLDRLRALVGAPGAWWQGGDRLAAARQGLLRFIANLSDNFAVDSAAWQRIAAPAHRQHRLQGIVAAIGAYPDDRQTWQAALAPGRPGA